MLGAICSLEGDGSGGVVLLPCALANGDYAVEAVEIEILAFLFLVLGTV